MENLSLIHALVLAVVIVAGIGAGLIGAYSYQLFVAHTKAQHPDTWTALGKPGYPEGPLAHRRLRPFLISGKYRTLHDERLNQLALRWRLVQLFQLAVILGAGTVIMKLVGVW